MVRHTELGGHSGEVGGGRGAHRFGVAAEPAALELRFLTPECLSPDFKCMLRHTELSGNGGQIGGGRGAHRRGVAAEPAAVCAAGGAAAGQGAPRAALRQRTRQGAAARGRARSD